MGGGGEVFLLIKGYKIAQLRSESEIPLESNFRVLRFLIDTCQELIAGQISQGKRAKKLVRQCGSVMKSRIRKMKRQWNNMNPFRVNSFVPFRLLYENHVALKYRKLGIKPTGEKGYPTCMLFIDGVKKMYIIKPFIKISE